MEQVDLNPHRSESDSKDYRLVTLQNGLRVLLVSTRPLLSQSHADESQIKAAAALAVQVGSYADPACAEGCAHYLEHMVFMGSTKYPEENHYDSFVTTHGGSCNAFTEGEYTVYSFDVMATQLPAALDIFSQCFISPLLSADALGREVEAIESEFQLAQMDDGSRLQQLMSHQMVDDHLLHKFSWGNKKSLVEKPMALNVDIHKEIRAFYARHYHPKCMQLVLNGPHTLDSLQQMVVDSFGSWNSHDQMYIPQTIAPSLNPFPQSELATLTRISPIKNANKLYLWWAIPSTMSDYEKKTVDYISFLVGHEGSGSILSQLKAENLAYNLSSGVTNSNFDENSACSFFNITVKLTHRGLANWTRVAYVIFSYLFMLQQQSPQQWIFDEMQIMGSIAFKYVDEEEAYDFVERLAPLMLPIYCRKDADLLSCGHLFKEWAPAAIQSLLANFLVPRKTKIYLSSKIFGPPLEAEDENLESEDDDFESGDDDDDDGSDDDGSDGSDYSDEEDENDEGVDGDGGDSLTMSEVLSLFDAPDPDWRNLLNPSDPITPETEPWFGLSYEQLALPSTLYSYWENICGDHDMHLPPKNTFIPSDLNMVSVAYPSNDSQDTKRTDHFTSLTVLPSRPVVHSFELGRHSLWFKLDTSFNRPKVDVFLDLSCPTCFAKDAHHAVLKDLIIKMFEDYVNEVVYLASMAELDVEIRKNEPMRWTLVVSGFSDKILFFSSLLAFNLMSVRFLFDEKRFFRSKALLKDEYANGLIKSEQIANGNRLDFLVLTRVPLSDKLRFVQSEKFESLSIEETIVVHQEFCSAMRLTGLVEGNVLEVRAMTWFNIIVDRLRVASQGLLNQSMSDIEILLSQVPASVPVLLKSRSIAASKERIFEISNHSLYVLHSNPSSQHESNVAVEIYFQHNKYNVLDLSKFDLLETLLSEPFFDQLRSKQQMGYSVSCGMRQSYGILGYGFKIVSSSHSLEQILAGILNFAFNAHTLIESFSADHFQSNIDSLIKSKQQPDLSLSDISNHHWNQITEELLDFSVREEQVRLLQNADEFNLQTMGKFTKDFFLTKCRAIVSLASPTSDIKSNKLNHTKVLNAILKKHFPPQGRSKKLPAVHTLIFKPMTEVRAIAEVLEHKEGSEKKRPKK